VGPAEVRARCAGAVVQRAFVWRGASPRGVAVARVSATAALFSSRTYTKH